MNSRLSSVLRDNTLVPETGRICVFGATGETDLSTLPQDRTDVVQGLYPEAEALRARGFSTKARPDAQVSLAIVCLPRAKALAQAWIKEAVRITPNGTVVIDGQKTDGIESSLTACKKRVALGGKLSKAHGKSFWFSSEAVFSDWGTLGAQQQDDGYWRAPGVFSADGIDPASEALVQALPQELGADIADLGAGWGYLSAQILVRKTVQKLQLIEADHAALDCAKKNVKDPRASFFWDDATSWTPAKPLDAVVMNPPFHTGRAATPDLGRAFIKTAARILKPAGQLFLVANRHLPYEAELTARFAVMKEVAGDNRFKILHAQKPTRPRR